MLEGIFRLRLYRVLKGGIAGANKKAASVRMQLSQVNPGVLFFDDAVNS